MTTQPQLPFTRAHLRAGLAFYLVFAAITFFLLSRQRPGDWRDHWNVAATIGCVSGPFTGAIARGFQSCCWRFSVGLFPYCAGLLFGAAAFQFLPLPVQPRWSVLRLAVWCVGLLSWFGGGLVSFGHALS